MVSRSQPTLCLNSLFISQLREYVCVVSPTPYHHWLTVCDTPPLAAPDPVDINGMSPLCVACQLGLAQVAVALLVGGADIDFAMPPPHGYPGGFTPLMHAAAGFHAEVVKLLLDRGADGAKGVRGGNAGHTALDITRGRADVYHPGYAETLAVLRLMCCSACGVTSAGLATTPGAERRLKRCGRCPARGPCAHCCGTVCQGADWVSRHRRECAEVRRARQAAGTEA